MKSLSVIIFIVSLVGIIHSGWELAVAAKLSSVEAQASLVTGSEPRLLSRPFSEEIRSVHEGWLELSTLAPTRPDIQYQLGRATLVLSLVERAFQKKISHFCDALSHFKRATTLSPHNARYHIAWADISSQIPQGQVCASPFPSRTSTSKTLSAPERLSLAQTLAPYSVVDLYLASLVYLQSGDKEKALSLFRLNQEINPRFSQAQREYVYQLITSEDELRQAIPQTYPEVMHWVWYFDRYREHDYLAWRPEFVKAVTGALTDVKERFRAQQIKPEQYSQFIKSINSLPLIAHSPILRRSLDDTLSNIYEFEGNSWWASALDERQALNRLPALKALIGDDKLPKETMLFSWVPDDEPRSAKLDVLGRSIGLYFPLGQHPKMLILQATSASARLSEDSLELLWSGDNLNFHSFDMRDVETGIVDGKETIIIRFSKADFRYLKIRYLGANRKPRFSNRFSDLIQAYGEVSS